MTTNRRLFLQQFGATSLVSLGGIPPEFLSRAIAKDALPSRRETDSRILVVVQLSGGNDGLNTVVPFGHDEYYKARPGIAVGRSQVLRLDDQVGLHPQMTGMKQLYDDGRLAIVQGVGYPNPDRSHFRSMDIWHSGRPDTEYTRDGWLGRALDAALDQHSGSLPAIAFGMEKQPLALAAAKVNVPTVESLNGYQLQLRGTADGRKRFQKSLETMISLPASPGSELDFLRQTTQTAVRSAKRLKELQASYRSTAEYPGTPLANRLKAVAQMIAGELGTRIFYLSLGGFDTHSQQQGAHQALLRELSGAIAAFFEDLSGHGLDDRVMLATFSEFGRRVAENGSLGTDHGAASQMFIVTSAGKGGLYGEHPSLTDLQQGDLQYQTDFRSVYATLLEKWLDFPSESVLKGQFDTMEFV